MWPENISEVIAACCVLHSICGVHRNDINEEWLQGVSTSEKNDIEDGSSTGSAAGSTAADSMRQAIIHFCQNNPVPE